MSDFAPDIAPDGAPVPPEMPARASEPRTPEVRSGDSRDVLPEEPISTTDPADVEETLYGGGEVEPVADDAPADVPPDTETEARPASEEGARVNMSDWSAEDAATWTAIQYEAQSFQRDLQDFTTAKTKLEEMKQTDPQRAQAYAPQVAAAEKELKERYGTLQQAAQGFQQGHVERHLKGEGAKMAEAFPELASDAGRKQLHGYLTQSAGFSPEEVATAADHRLAVLAEKARRYDEMTGGKRKSTPKIPPLKGKSRGKPKAKSTAEDIRGRPGTPYEQTVDAMYGPPEKPFEMPKSTKRTAEDILYPRSS